MLVEAVVAEGAVEAFDESVARGLGRLGVMQVDAVVLRPLMQRPAGELRAIVGDEHLGLAALAQQAFQRARYANAADGMVHDDSQTLARELIDDRQAAKTPSVAQLVVDE